MTCTEESLGRLRQLGVADLQAVERHLLELRFTDRRARFQSAVADTVIAAYVRQMVPTQSVLVGVTEAPTGRIVGLAEAHRGEAPRTAEIAVSVHERYQRQGLGRRLVWYAVALAFENGTEIAKFDFDPGNRALIELVRRLGARIDSVRGRAWICRHTATVTSEAA
jgi:GNAT superfamily N-acetyltransferase